MKQATIAPPATTAAARYTVLVVELNDTDATKASVIPADFATDDLDVAQAWVDGYNGRELENPVDSWAVIRVCSEGGAL